MLNDLTQSEIVLFVCYNLHWGDRSIDDEVEKYKIKRRQVIQVYTRLSQQDIQ